MNRSFSVRRGVNAEAGIGSTGIAVRHFFVSRPPFPKRKEPKAWREEVRSWRSLHETGFVLWVKATLRGETEEGSGINPRGKSDLKKTKAQENCCSSSVGSKKLIRRKLRIPWRSQHSWKYHNCRDDNSRERGQYYARAVDRRSQRAEDHVIQQRSIIKQVRQIWTWAAVALGHVSRFSDSRIIRMLWVNVWLCSVFTLK